MILKKYQMRGGRRPGAGRKKNIPNKASANREREVAASGATPLEVMLKSMRLLMALADENTREKRKFEHYLRAAASVAKDVAPYIHPRLSTVELNGNPDRPIAHRVDLLDGTDLQSLTAEQLADLYREAVRTPPTAQQKSSRAED
jgi:hypothetical protein